MFFSKTNEEMRSSLIKALDKFNCPLDKMFARVRINDHIDLKCIDKTEYRNVTSYKLILKVNNASIDYYFINFDKASNSYVLTDDILADLYKKINNTLYEFSKVLLSFDIDEINELTNKHIFELKTKNKKLGYERLGAIQRLMNKIPNSEKHLYETSFRIVMRISEEIGRNGNRMQRLRTKLSQKKNKELT